MKKKLKRHNSFPVSPFSLILTTLLILFFKYASVSSLLDCETSEDGGWGVVIFAHYSISEYPKKYLIHNRCLVRIEGAKEFLWDSLETIRPSLSLDINFSNLFQFILVILVGMDSLSGWQDKSNGKEINFIPHMFAQSCSSMTLYWLYNLGIQD